MAAAFEFIIIAVLMLMSTILRNRKKGDKNTATSAGRTASNAYDPSAPPGSRRNPLGKTWTAGTSTTATARSSVPASSGSRRTGKTLSFAEMRGDIPGFGRRASGTSLADDGHRLGGREDISCRQFGHSHPELDDMPRYIPHNDPENGYIVLNGKMMLLSEADKYENTI